MERLFSFSAWGIALVFMAIGSFGFGAETFRVGTYNVENYLLHSMGNRPEKTSESRAQVRAMIKALRADVLALQEIGGPEALESLREDLHRDGVDYPYSDLASGHDPYIQVAVLSRFPIAASHRHTNDSFLLFGRRFFVSRGFLEVDLSIGSHYRFTLMCAHLKSRRAVPEANEEELREQEAVLFREKIDARLKSNPKANLVVLGDFNDTKESQSIRAILGKGPAVLIDTRPGEGRFPRDGDNTLVADSDSKRPITWTHYYAKEDSYSRIDYLLLSRGMFHEWVKEQTCVLARGGWGVASDHRPLVATFRADDHGILP